MNLNYENSNYKLLLIFLPPKQNLLVNINLSKVLENKCKKL